VKTESRIGFELQIPVETTLAVIVGIVRRIEARGLGFEIHWNREKPDTVAELDIVVEEVVAVVADEAKQSEPKDGQSYPGIDSVCCTEKSRSIRCEETMHRILAETERLSEQ
jgi:hypothetical protein